MIFAGSNPTSLLLLSLLVYGNDDDFNVSFLFCFFCLFLMLLLFVCLIVCCCFAFLLLLLFVCLLQFFVCVVLNKIH